MSSCVVVDAGNTSTGIARVEASVVSRQSHIRGGMREPQRVEEALLKAWGRGAEGVVLGSVVPEENHRWCWLIERVTGVQPLIVTARVPMEVRIDYPKPASIGADRLANACGALRKHGAPVIVADFGTALTFDVISRDRTYIGGVIAPGLPVMTDYLHERTALLPRIRLGGTCAPVGRSTKGAMRIGAHVGYRGMTREIWAYLRESVGTDAALCATGGFARWALEGLDLPIVFDPDLTLYGLACIFETGRARAEEGQPAHSQAEPPTPHAT